MSLHTNFRIILLACCLCVTVLAADERVHDLVANQVQHFRVHFHKSNKGIVFVACDSSYCSRLTIPGWRKGGTLQYEGRHRCDNNGGGSCFLVSYPTSGLRYPEKVFETGVYDFVVQRQYHRERLGSSKNTLTVWMRNRPGDVAEVPISEDSGRLTIRPIEHNNMTVEWINPAAVLTENTFRGGFNHLFGITTSPPPTTTDRWSRRGTTTKRPSRRF